MSSPLMPLWRLLETRARDRSHAVSISILRQCDGEHFFDTRDAFARLEHPCVAQQWHSRGARGDAQLRQRRARLNQPCQFRGNGHDLIEAYAALVTGAP